MRSVFLRFLSLSLSVSSHPPETIIRYTNSIDAECKLTTVQFGLYCISMQFLLNKSKFPRMRQSIKWPGLRLVSQKIMGKRHMIDAYCFLRFLDICVYMFRQHCVCKCSHFQHKWCTIRIKHAQCTPPMFE